MNSTKRIAVFCGSRKGSNPAYIKEAEKLADLFIEHSIELVYGGGKVGLMGVIADAMLRQGGNVIGVIPQKLFDKEVGHTGITELITVDTMHERKAIMADLSDAFIALPGGIGTLEELFEVFTWSQIGYHNKPCALVNINNFFSPLNEMLDHTVTEDFLSEEYRNKLISETSAEKVLNRILPMLT